MSETAEWISIKFDIRDARYKSRGESDVSYYRYSVTSAWSSKLRI